MKKIILSGLFFSLISLTVQGQTMRTAKSESGTYTMNHQNTVVHLKNSDYHYDELTVQAELAAQQEFLDNNPVITTRAPHTSNRPMVDIIPTAGATETFYPAAGDYFFDPGGPGGGLDGSAGNYPNCGCSTYSTLADVDEIEFKDFEVFGNFDWLKVYDGTDTSGVLLYDSNVDGDTFTDMITSNGYGVFNSTSGNFHFEFYASTVVNRLGWEVEITSVISGGGGNGNECDQGDITTNSFDDAFNITENSPNRIAVGFAVAPTTMFTIDTITVDVNQQELPDNVIFNFREDNNGTPGTIVQTLTTIQSSSSQYGMAFGDPVYHLIFDLSSNPLVFTQGDYWMEVIMSVPSNTDVWWLASEIGSHPIQPVGSGNGGATWSPIFDYYMIFNLSGTCDPDTTPPSGYCIPGANCEDNDMITNVTFREIDNTTGCSPDGYEDFTHMTATVAPGDSYPVFVTVGSGWYERVSLWIDWDQNEVFDASDYVGEIEDGGQGVTLEDMITIPAGTPDGEYRMRFGLLAAGQTGTAPDDPCYNNPADYGEFEDYTLVVDSAMIGIADITRYGFSYYPNPANDILYLSTDKPIVSVVGYNMLGQLLISDNHYSNNQIDVGSLPAGAYLFYVTFDNGEKESFRVLVK